MIDINKTLDTIKFKFINEWLYTSHYSSQGEKPFVKTLTEQMVEKYVDPLNLPVDANIIDIDCGAGYFLEAMKTRGYSSVIGTTLSETDLKICKGKELNAKVYDPTFLPQKDGFDDETVDFIYASHSLSKSPYPIITLAEYNRVLKQNGKIFIEVPAPDSDFKHEFVKDNYSILGQSQWNALLERTGFKVNIFNVVEFDLHVVAPDSGEKTTTKEKYYVILVTKTQPIDIK